MRLGLLIVVGVVGALPPASATPTGRIVRVERGTGSRDGIRFCFDPTPEKTAVCFGILPPKVNDMITMIDYRGIVAELRVTKVQKVYQDCHNRWETDFALVRGSLENRREVLGVIGGGLLAKGHMLKDQVFKLPNQEQAYLVVDRDGDETPDIAVSIAQCASGSGMCAALWMQLGGTFTRISETQDVTPCVR